MQQNFSCPLCGNISSSLPTMPLCLIASGCACLGSPDNLIEALPRCRLLGRPPVEHLAVQRPVRVRIHLAAPLLIAACLPPALKPGHSPQHMIVSTGVSSALSPGGHHQRSTLQHPCRLQEDPRKRSASPVDMMNEYTMPVRVAGEGLPVPQPCVMYQEGQCMPVPRMLAAPGGGAAAAAHAARAARADGAEPRRVHRPGVRRHCLRQRHLQNGAHTGSHDELPGLCHTLTKAHAQCTCTLSREYYFQPD